MNAKTTVTKGPSPVRNWHLIDLSGQTLGRVSTVIAQILIGKDKPVFSFHRDDGDYVIAINASQIVVTGNKLKEKIYYHHTAYAGHLRSLTLAEMMKKDARQVIMHAVEGMLPKNRIRDRRLARLKVFLDANHPYQDKIKVK